MLVGITRKCSGDHKHIHGVGPSKFNTASNSLRLIVFKLDVQAILNAHFHLAGATERSRRSQDRYQYQLQQMPGESGLDIPSMRSPQVMALMMHNVTGVKSRSYGNYLDCVVDVRLWVEVAHLTFDINKHTTPLQSHHKSLQLITKTLIPYPKVLLLHNV